LGSNLSTTKYILRKHGLFGFKNHHSKWLIKYMVCPMSIKSIKYLIYKDKQLNSY